MNPTKGRKEHWESIYINKKPNEVSWYQPVPTQSLQFFSTYGIDKTANIIDVGGGDSLLVDHLLDNGYQNITVLDISEAAILRAQNRLGEKAYEVQWVVKDILDYVPQHPFDVWHDRAAFHFLTRLEDIQSYTQLTRQWIRSNGYLFLGTFSINGPEKCSGIQIQQYSEKSLNEIFGSGFNQKQSFRNQHSTPFNTQQEFLFGVFQKE